jgi:hypothetical protein
MILLYNSLLKNMGLGKELFGLNRKSLKLNKFSFLNLNYKITSLNVFSKSSVFRSSKSNSLYRLKKNSLYDLFLNTISKYLSLFKFCYYYVYNRQTFVYLYQDNSKELNSYLNSFFQPHTLFQFERNYKFYNYIDFIFNNLYVNFNNLIF